MSSVIIVPHLLDPVITARTEFVWVRVSIPKFWMICILTDGLLIITVNRHRILGYFEPQELNATSIKLGISEILNNFDLLRCQIFPVEVRGPRENLLTLREFVGGIPLLGIDVETWHQDGSEGNYGYGVFWASSYPTELRYLDSKEPISFSAGDIILFDHECIEHRIPYSIGDNRWFARYSVMDHGFYGSEFAGIETSHQWELFKAHIEDILSYAFSI